jgi:hypothetical protein
MEIDDDANRTRRWAPVPARRGAADELYGRTRVNRRSLHECLRRKTAMAGGDVTATETGEKRLDDVLRISVEDGEESLASLDAGEEVVDHRMHPLSLTFVQPQNALTRVECGGEIHD